MERCGVDESSRGARLAAFAVDRVRAARGILAAENLGRKPLAHLSRAGGGVDSLREAAGLHAHRADADHGASVRWLVGLSDGRLLRGDTPLRLAGGFYVLCGLLPPRRNRRLFGLDASAFSAGCARARLFLRY